MNPIAPILCTALPAAIIAAEHYAPWLRWLHRPLPRLAAYAMGTLAILLPATAAANPRRERETVALFWASAVSAGVTTLALWGIDWLNERSAKRADEMDRLTHGK
jgi:hypothetical protein